MNPARADALHPRAPSIPYPDEDQITQEFFTTLPGTGNQQITSGECAGLNREPHRLRKLFTLAVSRVAHSLAFRNRNALAITETELKLMAAPAMMGLNSAPKNG